MITPPPTWYRSLGHQLLELTPPSLRARIRYHERLEPSSFEAIVDTLTAGFRTSLRGPMSRFITEEGEYGAWCSLAGQDEDGAARRWIGAVACDEFTAAIDATCRDPEHDDLIQRTARWLIERASFGLGTRRRRFVFQRPPGWNGVANGLVVTFLPPDYPRQDTVLEVHPAEPWVGSAEAAFNAILVDEQRRGLMRSGAEQRLSIRSFGGVAGTLYSYAGRWPGGDEPRAHDLGLLVDGRYRYVARLETRGEASGDEEREVLARVLASVQPLPLPGGRDPGAVSQSGLTAPWVE